MILVLLNPNIFAISQLTLIVILLFFFSINLYSHLLRYYHHLRRKVHLYFHPLPEPRRDHEVLLDRISRSFSPRRHS